jgi:hypothetical protein
MAWTDLASNQIPTFTDLQTSGFSLNSGQSAVTSNECVTKANALAKYNLSSTAMNAFESNQLVPKSSYASGSVTSYSYSVKLGTTTTNVCTATPTTVYSDVDVWGSGEMPLFTDAALTIGLSGWEYAVLDGETLIYDLADSEGYQYLSGTTSGNCSTAPTAYGYTVKLGNDSENVCTAISTFVYSSSSSFGAGITLYDSASLTTLIQTYSYVVESGAIYELNSTTGVVGTFVGNC